LNWIAVKHFPIDQDLSALSQYLNRRGLVHRIAEQETQQCLSVMDASVIPALQDFLTQYERGQVEFLPEAPVPTPAVSQMPSLTAQAVQTPVVVGLILFSVLGTLLVETKAGNLWLHYFSFQDFRENLFLPLSASLAAGEIWRLLTPVFLHFGVFHVLFNSLWMWDLGRRMEFFLGRWHFLLFFIITGVSANVAQYLWSGDSRFGGMSGVVYALVGFIAVRQRMAPHPLVAVPLALIGFMLLWLVLCMSGVVDYFIAGSVGNAAHLGGLVAGAFYALLTNKLYRR
jgi:GlpG protein